MQLPLRPKQRRNRLRTPRSNRSRNWLARNALKRNGDELLRERPWHLRQAPTNFNEWPFCQISFHQAPEVRTLQMQLLSPTLLRQQTLLMRPPHLEMAPFGRSHPASLPLPCPCKRQPTLRCLTARRMAFNRTTTNCQYPFTRPALAIPAMRT